MAVGDTITATRYNNIRNRLDAIMGIGSGQLGYGQALQSLAVTGGNVNQVFASEMNALHNDLSRASAHQTGSAPTGLIAQVLAGTSLIGESAGAVGSGGTTATATTRLLEGYADYESLVTTIENNATNVDSTQLSTEAGITATRDTAWGASPDGIVHTVTITFAGYTSTNTNSLVVSAANHARAFFNAGGEILIRASRTGGAASTKNSNWTTILTNAGTIKFGRTQTTSTGTATGSLIGWFDLTTSDQQIATKIGTGVYAENDYTILARRNATSTQIILTIQFNDDDAGDPSIDETVDGTLTSVVEMSRPSGTNVNVVAPSFSGNTIA